MEACVYKMRINCIENNANCCAIFETILSFFRTDIDEHLSDFTTFWDSLYWNRINRLDVGFREFLKCYQIEIGGGRNIFKDVATVHGLWGSQSKRAWNGHAALNLKIRFSQGRARSAPCSGRLGANPARPAQVPTCITREGHLWNRSGTLDTRRITKLRTFCTTLL